MRMQKAQEAFQREMSILAVRVPQKSIKIALAHHQVQLSQQSKHAIRCLLIKRQKQSRESPRKRFPGVGVSPKRQSRNTSAGKPAGGGFRQNENPFKRSPDHSIGHFHMTAEPSDFQSRFGEVYIDESQPREEDSHGK